LKNNGIQVIFLDEYMEQQPLQKTAYIKLFGKLLGKEKEAEANTRK
jgi:iron complex transport system substrate-binding protein